MMTTTTRRATAVLSVLMIAAACSGPSPPPSSIGPTAQNLLLITIDTLRADRVGAYGYSKARTPAMDALARDGVRFTQAWTTAPITLPAHASLLTGRYPPGHRARHNGMAMSGTIPTLATALGSAGFATAAFVSAFPLDRRFGLARGFDIYDDELPRAADRRPLNERPGDETVRRASAWLTAIRDRRFFLWVHLFEPHAPYGQPGGQGSVSERYDDEVATADRAVAHLLAALGERGSTTLVVLAADHGEAFGEHGEVGHSVFVYETTIRIPLLLRGPGLTAGTVIETAVSLVDVAPTVLPILGTEAIDTDGRSLAPALTDPDLGPRTLYAESFAPLLDFGWSPLGTVRDGNWKYIAAPRAELYELTRDAGEHQNLVTREQQRASRLLARVEGHRGVDAPSAAGGDQEATNRLRALGYLGGGAGGRASTARPDPKDRIQLASRLAEVTSGEVRGDALIETLEAILKEEPDNPQARLRLGYAEVARDRCDRAEPHLRFALAAKVPSADAGLALADCRGRANDLAGAGDALEAARALEPGNPVVEANLGLLALARDDTSGAIRWLEAALAKDDGLLEARFALSRALARAGRREEAAVQARQLLGQLAPDAPERREVQRLLDALLDR